jgi:hypothetical protein
MQEALGIVIFVVVGVGAVLAVVSLFGRSRLYDDIGRGGLSIGEDRDLRPRASSGAPAPVNRAERDDEIRQMLEARNERRRRRGLEPLDVEAEMRALDRPANDAGLEAEVRALVVARNERRARQGRAPLDVDVEVARRLREHGGAGA